MYRFIVAILLLNLFSPLLFAENNCALLFANRGYSVVAIIADLIQEKNIEFNGTTLVPNGPYKDQIHVKNISNENGGFFDMEIRSSYLGDALSVTNQIINPELKVMGVSMLSRGEDKVSSRVLIPTPETLNKRLLLHGYHNIRFLGVLSRVANNGVVSGEIYDRFLATRTLLVAMDTNNYRHDVIDHGPGYVWLSQQPIWIRLTDTLTKTFEVIDDKSKGNGRIRGHLYSALVKPVTNGLEEFTPGLAFSTDAVKKGILDLLTLYLRSLEAKLKNIEENPDEPILPF